VVKFRSRICQNADFRALTSAATGKSNGLRKTAGQADFAGAISNPSNAIVTNESFELNFMGTSSGGTNKGIEDRLDKLHKAHLTIILITIVSVAISVIALVIAFLAWQRPIVPNSPPTQTLVR
jgi:hypothetical protein